MNTLGVISDTHGLLREDAVALLQGVDHIVHAGDIGNPTIIERLERIAPVSAIRGNVDVEPWASLFADTLQVTLFGQKIFVILAMVQIIHGRLVPRICEIASDLH
nr:metallophosphoesterase family protein [Aminobacter aminovorans]